MRMNSAINDYQKPWKILIIDDEQDICYYLKRMLEGAKKFQVWATTDPYEGIQLAQTVHPHIALLDIMLPDIDGSVVAERLKENKDTRDIILVFSSVLVLQHEIEQHNGHIGGYHFIPKSLPREDFIDRLEKIMEKAEVARL
jgi:CheY-like chemotaxis protein